MALLEPSLHLAPMEAADLPELLRLEAICFPDPWSREAFLQEIRSGRSGYNRVLRTGEKLAGYFISWFVADEAHLANIAVAPEWRGRGLGAFMIEDLLRESRIRGAEQIVLEVRVGNLSAIRLYRRYRFEPVAIRKNYYARQHEDALVMIRRVGSKGKENGSETS